MADFAAESLAQLAETPPATPEQNNPDGLEDPSEALAMPAEGHLAVEQAGEDVPLAIRLIEAVRYHMPHASAEGHDQTPVDATVPAYDSRNGQSASSGEIPEARPAHWTKKPATFAGSQRAWERLHGKFRPLSKKWATKQQNMKRNN